MLNSFGVLKDSLSATNGVALESVGGQYLHQVFVEWLESALFYAIGVVFDRRYALRATVDVAVFALKRLPANMFASRADETGRLILTLALLRFYNHYYILNLLHPPNSLLNPI